MQVKELLLPFGALKAFDLVMDKNTGNSKVGYIHMCWQLCSATMSTMCTLYFKSMCCSEHSRRPMPIVICHK